MQLMMNLAPWAIYYAQFPFKNAVLGSADFRQTPINQLANCCTIVNGAVTSINIEFDEYGWPLSLAGQYGDPSAQAATLYFGAFGAQNYVPAGTYLLSAEGAGTLVVVTFDSEGNFVNEQVFHPTGGGRQSFEVTLGQAGQLTVPAGEISLLNSGGSDYLRNVMFMMPNPAFAGVGTPSTTPYAVEQASIWHDTFLAECKGDGPGYAAFRMMDLLQTNNSTITDWSQLAQCDANLIPLGTTTYGNLVQVPYKLLLDLLAHINPEADVYWNIPFHATDAFVTSCAQFLQQNFPNKVYLEYSNEVWNGVFQQFLDAITAGCNQFGGGVYSFDLRGYNYSRQYYGYRTKQVHDLFRAAFAADANPARLVNVIASQAIGAANQPGTTWAQYIATGDAYSTAIAPVLIINAYYGATYAGSTTNGEGQTLTAATLAAGAPAVLAAWGPSGASSVGPDWSAAAGFAASIGSTWMIYEGQVDPNQYLNCSSSNEAYETQSMTVGSATGGTFTLTMPYSQVPELTLPCPFQPVPSSRADSTTPALAWNATPNQIRTALGTLPLMTGANGVEVTVTTSSAGGLNAPSAPGDVLTISFGLDPDQNPPNEYNHTLLDQTPTPLLTAQSSLTGGSGPTIARVTAGRQADASLMSLTIAAAQADPSCATLITNLFRYANATGARVFGFYGSVAETEWGIKPYQGADPSTRPISQGVSAYLENPGNYPAVSLPPPAVSLSAFTLSGASFTATARFTMTATISAVQASDTTVGITSTAPGDFLNLPGSIVVPAGQTSATATCQVASTITAVATVNITAAISYQSITVGVSLMPFTPPFVLNSADSRASACAAFYPFYEGSGTTIHDCGPNGWHLLLNEGAIGTDAFWVPGPGTGTAAIGQYGMRAPYRSGYFRATVAGATLTTASLSVVALILDNQDTGQGPGYDQGVPVMEYFANGNASVCTPFSRSGGGDSFVGGGVADSAFSGATPYTSTLTNPTPASWMQHGFGSSAAGLHYWLGSLSATTTYPATPVDALSSFGFPTNGYGNGFSGTFGGLAIFNRTLTDAELQRPLSSLIVPTTTTTTTTTTTLPTSTTAKPMRFAPAAAGARPPARKPAAVKASPRLFR